MSNTINEQEKFQSQLVIQCNIARNSPRPNIDLIIQQVREEIMASERIAENAQYKIPRKRKNDKGEYEETFITGPTIDLARYLLTKYKNIAVQELFYTSGFMGQDVTAQAVAWDMEANIVYSGVFTEMLVNRDGIPFNNDIQNLKKMSAMSKAARKAILSVIPGVIVETALDASNIAMDKFTQNKPKDKIIEGIKKFNESWQCTDQILCEFFKIKSIEEFSGEQYIILRQIHQSLRYGDLNKTDWYKKTEYDNTTETVKKSNVINFADEE